LVAVPAYQSTQLCAIASEPDQFFKSAPNGGSVRVLPGRACHTALRGLAGINQRRGDIDPLPAGRA
jgi:hypothetical protein